MNKIKHALRLAKDCTYADLMTEGAKEHLRNEIHEALKDLCDLEKLVDSTIDMLEKERNKH